MKGPTKIISSPFTPCHKQKAGVVIAKRRLEASFVQAIEKLPRSPLCQMSGKVTSHALIRLGGFLCNALVHQPE